MNGYEILPCFRGMLYRQKTVRPGHYYYTLLLVIYYYIWCSIFYFLL